MRTPWLTLVLVSVLAAGCGDTVITGELIFGEISYVRGSIPAVVFGEEEPLHLDPPYVQLFWIGDDGSIAPGPSTKVETPEWLSGGIPARAWEMRLPGGGPPFARNALNPGYGPDTLSVGYFVWIDDVDDDGVLDVGQVGGVDVLRGVADVALLHGDIEVPASTHVESVTGLAARVVNPNAVDAFLSREFWLAHGLCHDGQPSNPSQFQLDNVHPVTIHEVAPIFTVPTTASHCLAVPPVAFPFPDPFAPPSPSP